MCPLSGAFGANNVNHSRTGSPNVVSNDYGWVGPATVNLVLDVGGLEWETWCKSTEGGVADATTLILFNTPPIAISLAISRPSDKGKKGGVCED